MKRIHFIGAILEWTSYGCRTTFFDGATLDSIPHQTIHYGIVAHQLGYGDDRMAFCRDHEAAHLFLAQKLGVPSVLHDVARNQPVTPGRAAAEEALCQKFQAFVRANLLPIIGDVDWEALKRDFLDLTDHH